MHSADPPDLHRELSLALHAAVASLLNDPIVQKARSQVDRWLEEGGSAVPLLLRWREILSMPLDEIRTWLTSRSEDAEWLRKASPFAGVLAPRQRESIIRETRRRLERRS
jgi:hypothetical protein